ncbi:polysaccharide biosynthesis/export family protein [Salibacteraceae bacterium]|nr:polysaccharide biosynthesis/export family protein [Salibacteraceae bacterium]
MSRQIRFALIVLVASIAFSSCRVFNPSIMLKTDRDYPFDAAVDSIPRDHILMPGDILTFQLFSNQGFKIIDLSTLDEGSQGNQRLNAQTTISYQVESDSSLNLPIIGRIKIAGFDLKEAEFLLEEKYSNYYQEPYIMLQIQNRRVTVFPGRGGDARVIPVTNEYITIVEALALAGGISDGGRAHRVKVFRGGFKNPIVYEVDLSSVEGLSKANMHYIRSNDIIYVEPSYFVAKQVLSAAGQIMALVTNSIATYLVVTNFANR